MSRMLVVSGLHLDRSWPELVPAFGAALRDWSRSLLPEIVAEAQRQQAETLLILGDLLDRETVLPDTVDYVTQVLGSFAGRVLIAPGRRDWAGDGGPYERGTFAANTGVWSSAPYAELSTAPGVYGSAWTSANPVTVGTPRGAASGARRVWVRPEVDATSWSAADPGELFVTSGETFHVGDGVFVAPHLVGAPGTNGSRGLLLDLTDKSVNAEIVPLPQQPGSRVELDVTPLRSTAALGRALDGAGRGHTPVHLSLVGTLAPGVLLPGAGGPMLGEQVHLDISGLAYADPPQRPGDHSMIAEFLRAMRDSPDDARTRHQITALGLRALTAEPNS